MLSKTPRAKSLRSMRRNETPVERELRLAKRAVGIARWHVNGMRGMHRRSVLMLIAKQNLEQKLERLERAKKRSAKS